MVKKALFLQKKIVVWRKGHFRPELDVLRLIGMANSVKVTAERKMEVVNTEVEYVIVDSGDSNLRRLVARLDEELMERYPKERIYGVDFDHPDVRRITFVIARREGEAVGCGGIRPLEGAEPSAAELKRFFVDRSCRKLGIAAGMLRYLEDRAREGGFREMRLETGSEQPEAIALYLKHGYRPIDRFGIYSDDPACLCYGKSLD
ncbi:GNAT family N-acetyltransferase [Paenibacillus zanthoxyli]|uniref:GNAT family N-acetyltransferase n=1 Tax=Paenibacillus zanthoxyli TaxID=369399 RepID=UPI00046F4DA1|nr:GNAT family N-acetyltransferase [Paenibacillus zanthoxyli]